MRVICEALSGPRGRGARPWVAGKTAGDGSEVGAKSDKLTPQRDRVWGCAMKFVVRRLAAFLLLGLAGFATLAAPAWAEKRVALVIGNGAYQNAPRLPNPSHDANDVAAALKRVGFETILGLDLNRDAMVDYEVRFARAARDADVALFYYSGHALQYAGVNYLMPVDTKLKDEADLRRMARVDDIVNDLQQARNLKILVLDSCRDNPILDQLKRSVGRTRGLSLHRGLAKIESPQGMIVAYATQAGRTAEDGNGRNSPYTTAFLSHIEERAEIGAIFRRISADVYQSTKEGQLPELSLSLIGEFYLHGKPSVSGTPALGAAAQAWAAIKDTTSSGVLEVFLQRYGDSIFAPFARARLTELKRKQQVALAAPVLPPVVRSPKLSQDDVVRLFNASGFDVAIKKATDDYVERPNRQKMLRGAIDGMRKAFPQSRGFSRVSLSGSLTVASVQTEALAILNRLPNAGDDQRVVNAAMDGLLTSLDPHSSFMDAKAFHDMQVQTRGEFGGLGVEISLENGIVKVVSPLDGTPAARAGVLAGDLITHLDDVPIKGLTLNKVVEKMRGKVGSKIKLTIVRQGQTRPIGLYLTRALIRVRGVKSRVEAGDIGYIRITQFNGQAAASFKKAVHDIAARVRARRLKGYIIDLRNDPGGLLSQVIAVASDVLEQGEIVSTRGRTAAETQRFTAKPGDIVKGRPIVVMINGGTASGAEILAGALHDNKRATVIGWRSFGKGSIQTIFPLGAGQGAIRLTTARYYTPSGRSIQAKGIEPDIEVLQAEPAGAKKRTKLKSEAALAGHLAGSGNERGGSQSYIPPQRKDDKALQRAVELLHGARH
jgi:carboxyl-terminal processing protease